MCVHFFSIAPEAAKALDGMAAKGLADETALKNAYGYLIEQASKGTEYAKLTARELKLLLNQAGEVSEKTLQSMLEWAKTMPEHFDRLGSDSLKYLKERWTKYQKNGTTEKIEQGLKEAIEKLPEGEELGLDGVKAIVEFKSRIIQSISELTDEEISALKKYTGAAYTNINNSLRGIEEATPENQAVIDIMKSALDSASLPENMTLYRGTSIEELGALKNLPPEELVGESFIEYGFMSTSTKSTVAEEVFMGNMYITIEASKGAHALDIASISMFKMESEILFNAGQEMLITSAIMKDDILYITVSPK